MAVFAWCSRRAGGLSVIALIALSYWVISRESNHKRHDVEQKTTVSQPSASAVGAGVWAFIFAYYCLFVHTLVFMVPLRACWSVWNLTQILKRAAQSSVLTHLKRLSLQRRDSLNSTSSSETLISHYKDTTSSTTSEAGDIDPETYTDGGDSAADLVIHAVIIPNYKEEYDSLRETLDVLASHPRARDSYDVYLGMEQREGNAETKALGLIQEFAKKFRSIDFTLHPGDIAGEAAGKGSNIAWAARELSSKYLAGERKDVIITGIDADSHLSSDYFALLTNMHLAYPETSTSTLYSAPIIFDRNSHNVPALVRVADILWSAAGLSGLYGGSTIAPPTSVYSLPLELVDRVGGWDCDSEAIGEDLHMFIKCFFALNGNLTCRVINSPVSQSNVTSGSSKGYRGAYADVKARYKQALRHMWGALDTGFALRKVVEMWQRRKQPTRIYRPLHSTHNATSDIYLPNVQTNGGEANQSCDNGIFSGIVEEPVDEPHWEHVLYLFHRLFEAHFLPVHMTILVLASTLYVKLTEGNGDPYGLAWAFNICNIVRILGFAQFVFYLFLYESFHRVCVAKRENEMVKAGLSDGMHFSRRSLGKNSVDYLVVPLVAPLYGAIPCAQAQISHFWTVDLVYTVSGKATRRQQKSTKAEDLA